MLGRPVSSERGAARCITSRTDIVSTRACGVPARTAARRVSSTKTTPSGVRRRGRRPTRPPRLPQCRHRRHRRHPAHRCRLRRRCHPRRLRPRRHPRLCRRRPTTPFATRISSCRCLSAVSHLRISATCITWLWTITSFAVASGVVQAATRSLIPSTAGTRRHLRHRRRHRRRQRHHHILHRRRRRRRRRRRCLRRRRCSRRRRRRHRHPRHRSRAMVYGVCSVWPIATLSRRPRAMRTTRSWRARRNRRSTLACGTWSIISFRRRAARTPRRTPSTTACHRPRCRRRRPHRRCPRRPHHRRPSTSSAIIWTSGNPSLNRIGALHGLMRGTV